MPSGIGGMRFSPFCKTQIRSRSRATRHVKGLSVVNTSLFLPTDKDCWLLPSFFAHTGHRRSKNSTHTQTLFSYNVCIALAVLVSLNC
jgi:hypothetical protein